MIEHIKEVFVAQHRVDFRKGPFGMRAEMIRMQLDPYAGDCCIFVHHSFRQIRLIGATSTGLWMIVKFFEAGALKQRFPFLAVESFVEISKSELSLLLDGAQIKEFDRVNELRLLPVSSGMNM
ncbi:MAG: IS66 family insertion sequence element accessory protein TnpB [Aquiluna sp.]